MPRQKTRLADSEPGEKWWNPGHVLKIELAILPMNGKSPGERSQTESGQSNSNSILPLRTGKRKREVKNTVCVVNN